MSISFSYRYVGYGTNFEAVSGQRREADQGSPTQLFDNEVVVDVGNRCFGHDGCTLPIFDHHFNRGPDNFPSAAAAVLHNAAAIVRPSPPNMIWLVTHQGPDFDAYCAMFLARSILDGSCPVNGWDTFGLAPGGWADSATRRIDWFNPRIGELPAERVWPILLASYASTVDQCRPLKCPRHRTLHAILYAAACRGRSFERTGAHDFFTLARSAILDQGLHPLFDGFFETSGHYEPELALLALEPERYARDLRRSRRSLVLLQTEPSAFDDWFTKKVQRVPLLDSDNNVAEIHLAQRSGGLTLADGIYLRDPESLLFKEWAREDAEASSLGQGFLFTLVAYSNAKPGVAGNRSDYYIALDPERAGPCHLYNVWARLQHEEWNARDRSALDSGPSREEFQARKVGRDPWYDGNAFRATIVNPPWSGTLIAAGQSRNLEDDVVARIVRKELEDVVFAGRVSWEDLPLDDGDETLKGSAWAGNLDGQWLQPNAFRLGYVVLEDTDLTGATIAQQVGRRLWALLEPPGVLSVPVDFVERHLIVRHDQLVIWSRCGLVIAHARGAVDSSGPVSDLQQHVRELVDVIRALRALSAERTKSTQPESRIQAGRTLLQRVAGIKLAAAAPAGLPLRRLLDAMRFDEVLSSLHALDLQDYAAADRRRDNRLQVILAAFATLAITFNILDIYPPNLVEFDRLLFRVGGAVLALTPLILVWYNRRHS